MAGKIVPLGTKTKWGIVGAVGFVGERYYWIVDKHGAVAMMPATDVEPARPKRRKKT